MFLTEKAARLGVQSPESARDREERFRLVAAAKGDTPVRARFERALTILAGITLLVLLVACTNFTNLMFARSEARRKEFAIRLALGGGRWRLVRQSAVECLGLAMVAGALSLLFATWATSVAMTLVAAIEPVDFALELNARVLALHRAALSWRSRLACGRARGPCGRRRSHPCIRPQASGATAGCEPLPTVSF